MSLIVPAFGLRLTRNVEERGAPHSPWDAVTVSVVVR